MLAGRPGDIVMSTSSRHDLPSGGGGVSVAHELQCMFMIVCVHMCGRLCVCTYVCACVSMCTCMCTCTGSLTKDARKKFGHSNFDGQQL